MRLSKHASLLRIRGGLPLNGLVEIAGAKNAALPCIFASLLSEQPLVLSRVPKLGDIIMARKILAAVGRKTSWRKGVLRISGGSTHSSVPAHLAAAMRASILALGPLLATRRSAAIPLPGGCDIGSRPIGIHLAGLKAMGATIATSGGVVGAEAPHGLHGVHFLLDNPSVTGTENLLMAACLADGETILENVALEPEIADLAALLGKMGAKIEGAGTATIRIQGTTSLGSAKHKIMPDRIEAGTFLCAVTATGGALVLKGIDAAILGSVIAKIRTMGTKIKVQGQTIEASMNRRPTAVSFETGHYPGFPTDLQAQMMAVDCIAQGRALVVENIFERRFRHADELNLFGANIEMHANCASINGVAKLQGARVRATDLRASASLVIGGLVAEGTSLIEGINHLERGYEQLPAKLRKLGARIATLRS